MTCLHVILTTPRQHPALQWQPAPLKFRPKQCLLSFIKGPCPYWLRDRGCLSFSHHHNIPKESSSHTHTHTLFLLGHTSIILLQWHFHYWQVLELLGEQRLYNWQPCSRMQCPLYQVPCGFNSRVRMTSTFRADRALHTSGMSPQRLEKLNLLGNDKTRQISRWQLKVAKLPNSAKLAINQARTHLSQRPSPGNSMETTTVIAVF